jgi:hypothetical protein
MERIERTFFCPNLDTQAATMHIKEVLNNTPGVLSYDVSLPQRTVQVVLLDPQGESVIRRHLSSVGCPPED